MKDENAENKETAPEVGLSSAESATFEHIVMRQWSTAVRVAKMAPRTGAVVIDSDVAIGVDDAMKEAANVIKELCGAYGILCQWQHWSDLVHNTRAMGEADRPSPDCAADEH